MTKKRALTTCFLMIILSGGVVLITRLQPLHLTDIILEESSDREGDQERLTADQKIESVPHSVSLPALMEKNFTGSDLKLVSVLDRGSAYTRYRMSYTSGAFTISGIANIPHGEGPFPVLLLNHGYIDPKIYTNGRGLKREQDYLARRGYAVFHSDYRNHAESDDDPENELNFRLGYTEDVINLVYALQSAKLPFLDAERVGMLGHSMGGGVTINTLVVQPDLVDAAVLFAPVSANYERNYERWTKRESETGKKIIERYGTPETNPDFWHGVSAKNYFDRIQSPIQNHHGTKDDSVEIKWSDELAVWLKEAGKSLDYYVYPGEPHEFTLAWPTVMQRTVEFFDQHLKSS